MTPSVRCLSNRWPATALSSASRRAPPGIAGLRHQHRSSTACISPAIRSRMRRPILATAPSSRQRDSAASPLRPMNFAGTPAGIDARKVVDTGILPIINTGIAHRDAGRPDRCRHYAGTARLLHQGRDGTRLDRAGRNAVKERHGSPLVCQAVP